MSIKLFIVRHGQPLSQELKQNIANTPLGKIGKKQAALAAAEIEKFGGIDVLYSSSLRRALETAKPFYEKYKVPWHVWPIICETGRRNWPYLRELQKQGKKLGWNPKKSDDDKEVFYRDPDHTPETFPLLSELKEHYPGIQLTQPFEWCDAWWLPLEDEIREVAYKRAKQFIEAIRERHGEHDCNVAAVCHGAFGSVLMTVLTEGTPCDHNRFSFAHGAFSLVKLYEDGTTQVLLSDYVAHLYPDHLTEF